MHRGDPDASDPWVTLGAIAVATARLVIGPLVTPLPRRRPWKVAREATTLDRLSHGRAVLGVGIGTDHYREFTAFAEPASDDRARAEHLDEALAIVTALWSGERLTHHGARYTADDVVQAPTPVQRPRIPIWCATTGLAPAPVRRAARWDGVVPVGTMSPDDVATLRTEIAAHRTTSDPFAIAIPSATASVPDAAAYAAAGATWWLASVHPADALADSRALVDGGPPTI